MRSGSRECHETVAQSTSQITTRPPGRSTRSSSPSAAGMSSTYSSTWTESTRSNSASAYRQGGDVAPWKRDVVVALAALGREREHRLAGVDADHRALRAHPLEHLGDVEPRPAAGVEHALARSGVERLVDERAPAQDVPPAVDGLQPGRHLLVEVELRHRL